MLPEILRIFSLSLPKLAYFSVQLGSNHTMVYNEVNLFSISYNRLEDENNNVVKYSFVVSHWKLDDNYVIVTLITYQLLFNTFLIFL